MTSKLRRLDDRLVPALAAFFDRLIPRPPPPTGPLPVILRLRRVDDRWTRRGVLALVREVPQLGAVAVAALVLTNGIVVANRNAAQQRAAQNGTEQGGGPSGENGDARTELGPLIGDNVQEYVTSTRDRLQTAAAGQPDANAIAVVSFAQYRTAAQVVDLLGEGTTAIRIFYRVPVGKLSEVPPDESPVADILVDAKKAFVQASVPVEQEVGNLTTMIATNDHDPVQKKADEERLALFQRVLRQLKGDCACIYAVLVQSKLRVLADLLPVDGIRAIDVSVPNARIGDYADYTGLIPEEKVTVTGGNEE